MPRGLPSQSPAVDHLSTARATAPPPPSGVEVDAGMAPPTFPPVASSVQAGVGASSAPAARVSGLDSVTGQLDQSALHPSSQSPSAPNVPSFAAAPGYTYLPPPPVPRSGPPMLLGYPVPNLASGGPITPFSPSKQSYTDYVKALRIHFHPLHVSQFIEQPPDLLWQQALAQNRHAGVDPICLAQYFYDTTSIMAEMIVAAVTPYNPMIESRMQSLHDQMTPEERAANCPGVVLRDNYVDAPPLIGFPFTSSVYHVVKMIGRIIAVDSPESHISVMAELSRIAILPSEPIPVFFARFNDTVARLIRLSPAGTSVLSEDMQAGLLLNAFRDSTLYQEPYRHMLMDGSFAQSKRNIIDHMSRYYSLILNDAAKSKKLPTVSIAQVDAHMDTPVQQDGHRRDGGGRGKRGRGRGRGTHAGRGDRDRNRDRDRDRDRRGRRSDDDDVDDDDEDDRTRRFRKAMNILQVDADVITSTPSTTFQITRPPLSTPTTVRLLTSCPKVTTSTLLRSPSTASCSTNPRSYSLVPPMLRSMVLQSRLALPLLRISSTVPVSSLTLELPRMCGVTLMPLSTVCNSSTPCT